MKKLLASAFALVLSTTSIAYADTASDTKAQIDAIQKQVDALKAQLDQLKTQRQTQPGGVTTPSGPVPGSTAAPGQGQPGAGESQQGKPASTDIFGRPVDAQGRTVDFQPAKPSPPPQVLTISPKGPGLTFLTNGGTVQLYGNVDLSTDITTKGLQGFYPATMVSPVGNVGYLAGISSNLSYIGVRGQQSIGHQLGMVYQLETQLDVSATSGTGLSTSNTSNIVKGGLTSRNSFIGLSNKYAGSVKIGKTDAPYKTSTARMNPFSAELGDYSSIMGNSGGDNRVEFLTRLDHALWYESPVLSGFTLNTLVSPGQNRGVDNNTVAAGEPDCAGGNIPGSGATPPFCNDGAYGSAYSSSLGYTRGKLYVTTAYELHKGVNRTSDLANLDPRNVVDESAIKGGFQYSFSKATSLSGIYEDMERYVPADLQSQNERSRNGFWLALTQSLNDKDNVNFGWARANPTPGDPGQHNTSGGAHPDNMANMYTFAYKHNANKFVSFYADYALQLNHPQAHFDLGAGGRGLTTDCHDGASPASFDATTAGVTGDGPHCFAGGRIQGFSTGIDFKF
jgi:predicted porin